MFQSILELASSAAVEAGRHALCYYGQAAASLKTHDQIVTTADVECQSMIIAAIRSRFPGHGIIAEEGPGGELLHQPPTGPDAFWWVIDPIDGTRNYAHGVSLFACSIGVIKDGKPYAGAIYDPCLEQLTTGGIETNAQRNGQTLRVLNESLHSNSQIAFSGNLYKRLPKTLGTFMADFVYVNLGSAALHYALVAAGAFTAAMSWNVKLWDIAAGAAIIQAAGGTVTSPHGQPIFPFDCQGYRGQAIPVLFAHQKVIEQIAGIIEPDHQAE